MKRILRVITMVITGIFLIATATSTVGAAITNSRSGEVNTKPGMITDDELKALFTNNHELLQSIAEQLIPLCEKFDLYRIQIHDEQLAAWNSVVEDIDIAHIDVALQQQLKRYFDVVGDNNRPCIEVTEPYVGYIVVEFVFRLTNAHIRGILYDTEGEFSSDIGYVPLGDNFYIYVWEADGPPIINGPCSCLKWWEKLPCCLQWILRHMFFGWFWMR